MPTYPREALVLTDEKSKNLMFELIHDPGEFEFILSAWFESSPNMLAGFLGRLDRNGLEIRKKKIG